DEAQVLVVLPEHVQGVDVFDADLANEDACHGLLVPVASRIAAGSKQQGLPVVGRWPGPEASVRGATPPGVRHGDGIHPCARTLAPAGPRVNRRPRPCPVSALT